MQGVFFTKNIILIERRYTMISVPLDPDKLVKANFLKEVSSSLFVNESGQPDPDGLFSYEIFGEPGSDLRRQRYAYIDLGGHYIHPKIYKDLVNIDRKIADIVDGVGQFKVNESSGALEKVADDDPAGNTGIDFLYNSWDKIRFRETASNKRENMVGLIKLMKKDEVFITKQIVIPAFYRDMNFEKRGGFGGSAMSTVNVNSFYKKLITTSQSLKYMGNTSYTFNLTKAIVQKTINEIYEHFKKLIQLKNGFMTKSVHGKNIDFGGRTLISAPSFNANRWTELPADFENVAVPLTQCVNLFIPFIQHYVKAWVDSAIMGRTNIVVYDASKKDVVRLELHKEWTADFEADKIASKADLFHTTPESRFDPVQIRFADNEYRPFIFIQGNKDITIEEGLNYDALKDVRYFTWADLFFIAAKEVCRNKHVLIVRDPVTSQHSEYFAGVRVRSTFDTVEMMIGDTFYKDYPKVDLGLSPERIETAFIDSLEIFPPFIKSLGADHDGDQVNIKGLFTYESNEWARNYIKSPKNVLGNNGSSVRSPGDVAKHTMWNIIRNPDSASKKLNDKETAEILSYKDDDITKELFISLFGNTENTKAKYNVNDILKIKPSIDKRFINGDTTIGRYFFNVFLNFGCFGDTFPYFNSDNAGDFNDGVDNALIEGKVNMDQVSKFQTKRAWFEYTNTEVVVPGMSFDMMAPHPKVMERKKELLKKYKEELSSPDTTTKVNAANAIEKELLALAADIFKDDPAFRLFDGRAGGKPSWGNNYKNMSVMVGATADNTNKGEFNIGTSNFVDGIDKDDYAAHADTNIQGTYARAVETVEGGTQTKEFNASLQGEVADTNLNSDCKTTHYQPLAITPDLHSVYKYKYAIVNGKEIVLTPDVLKGLNGKTVLVRSAMYCKNEKYCAKCIGTLNNVLQAKYIGLTAASIGSTILNLKMKQAHDISLSSFEIKWESYFKDY
jgi:hypothetical protein